MYHHKSLRNASVLSWVQCIDIIELIGVAMSALILGQGDSAAHGQHTIVLSIVHLCVDIQ